jgi:hypothetical protein
MTDIMRSQEIEQQNLFSYVSMESRIPKNHPLRSINIFQTKQHWVPWVPHYLSVPTLALFNGLVTR